jgi:hypothetical protein
LFDVCRSTSYDQTLYGEEGEGSQGELDVPHDDAEAIEDERVQKLREARDRLAEIRAKVCPNAPRKMVRRSMKGELSEWVEGESFAAME